MTWHPLHGNTPPSPIIRGLAALGFVGVFAVVAMIVRPNTSTAISPAIEPAPQKDRLPAYVGSLEGKELRVDVFVTPAGAKYTVRNSDGSVVANLIDEKKLAQRFPQFQNGKSVQHMADTPVDDSFDPIEH